MPHSPPDFLAVRRREALEQLRRMPDAVLFSAASLAWHFSLPAETLRKRLARFMAQDATCFIEDTERRCGCPRNYYILGRVRQILEELLRSPGPDVGP